jgi:hypothetical protein
VLVLLAVLAVAQMGVHLVLFLHISSAPDQMSDFLALAFGIFITAFIVFGSLMIMSHLNHSMMWLGQLPRRPSQNASAVAGAKMPHLAVAGRVMITRFDAPWQGARQIL